MGRKYSAFTELRETLFKLYPGYIIPPIHKKISKSWEPDHLNKRKYFLQLFLNDLLIHPVIKRSGMLKAFLSIDNEKDYEGAMKLYEKDAPMKDAIIGLRTPQGFARIDCNKEAQLKRDEIHDGLPAIMKDFKE